MFYHLRTAVLARDSRRRSSAFHDGGNVGGVGKRDACECNRYIPYQAIASTHSAVVIAGRMSPMIGDDPPTIALRKNLF